MSEPDDIVTRDDDLELQNSRDRLPGGRKEELLLLWTGV